jgi:hypothetical protein
VQGYNAQAATTCGRVIVAAELTQDAGDFQQLEPMLTATAATGLLIYGLVHAGDAGWGDTSTLVPLPAAGLALALALLTVERAVRAPRLRLELLTRRPLLAGTLLMLAASALLSSFFLSSLYLQRVLGYSALRTGLVFLPVALAITASPPRAWARRW